MKVFRYALLVFLVLSQNALAADKDPNCKDPNDPEELLRFKWDAVASVLQNKEMDLKAKEKKIDKIICPIFDFAVMGKLALGRENWPKLNPQQQEKFIKLFVERLKTTYREKITLYTNETVSFKPALHKTNSKIINVPMELIYKDKKVVILYKLRKVEKRWKIYDVEIQGVSILLTYRSQFNDILRSGSVDDLLARLEKPVEH